MDEISETLFELCLRALYHAPDDKPSLALLLDMHGDVSGFRAALQLAFTAGQEAAYDTDEWRVMDPGPRGVMTWSRCLTEEIGHEDLADARWENPDAYLEHCRTGATEWKKVNQDA